jgi:hypothetical protein
MTADQILALEPALAEYLGEFDDCFGRSEPLQHLKHYVRGHLQGEHNKAANDLGSQRFRNPGEVMTAERTALKHLCMRYLGLVSILLTVASLTWHMYDSLAPKGPGVQRLEHALKTNVPPGTTRRRVEAWLVNRGISDYSSRGNRITAVITDVPNVSYGWSGDIWIEFYFDDKDRLTDYRLEAQAYAL